MILKRILITVLICIDTYIYCGEYYRLDGHTYFSSYPDMRNWYQAKRFCTYNGWYLVDVRSDEENKRILSVINHTETINHIDPSNYWTSGTELGRATNYNYHYWDTTGHPFMFQYWAINQPDGDDNCVLYWGLYGHKWNDETCSESFYFICRDTFDVPSYKVKDCSLHAESY